MPADRVGGQGGVAEAGSLVVVKSGQRFDMGRMPVPAGRYGVGVQVRVADEERFHPAAQVLELLGRFLARSAPGTGWAGLARSGQAGRPG